MGFEDQGMFPWGEANPSGYVYIIEEMPTRLCKLGFAGDPLKRIRQLQTGNCHDLILRASHRGTPKDEQGYHRMLRKFRVRGEWYDLLSYLKWWHRFYAYADEGELSVVETTQSRWIQDTFSPIHPVDYDSASIEVCGNCGEGYTSPPRGSRFMIGGITNDGLVQATLVLDPTGVYWTANDHCWPRCWMIDRTAIPKKVA